MIRAYTSWKSKIQHLKILEYFLRSIKKRICKTEKFKFFKVCLFMHSILGRSSFSTNDSISEVWHGSDQPVALLRHYWAFSSSVLLDRLFLIFLLKISHRFHTATPFSNDLLWLTLFVEGVNDCLLDHCQVSSLPHYCGFKEQEIPGIYTVWMVI